MKITRQWAMPSPDTFSIEPIAALLNRWLGGRSCIVDPFARNSRLAHWRNDLNPATEAESHKDAVEFLMELYDQNIETDVLLFDPPYSPRQISEVYAAVGRECGMEATQNARLYRMVKDAADRLMTDGAVAICCGWNSAGMGIGRGYELKEILIVPHGGAHNDTIVTVETKTTSKQGNLCRITPANISASSLLKKHCSQSQVAGQVLPNGVSQSGQLPSSSGSSLCMAVDGTPDVEILQREVP